MQIPRRVEKQSFIKKNVDPIMQFQCITAYKDTSHFDMLEFDV